MIEKKFRFHGHGSLGYLYRNGVVVYLKPFTFKYVKNKFRKNPRIAVVVSKKVSKSAVGRNRIRRRIYEHMRQLINKLDGTYDIAIIVTSADLINMESKEILAYLKQAMVDAGIYKS